MQFAAEDLDHLMKLLTWRRDVRHFRPDPVPESVLSRMAEAMALSTAMAIHALWLAARAQNLGMGMVSILDPHRIERLLQVPEDWRFTVWLCIGYPEASDDLPLLHRMQWQENAESAWVEC